MAKRFQRVRTVVRRVGARAVRAVHRGRGTGMGKTTETLTDGVLASIARRFARQIVPGNAALGDALGLVTVGHYRRNPVLVTMAGLQLGEMLATGGLNLGGLLGGTSSGSANTNSSDYIG